MHEEACTEPEKYGLAGQSHRNRLISGAKTLPEQDPTVACALQALMAYLLWRSDGTKRIVLPSASRRTLGWNYHPTLLELCPLPGAPVAPGPVPGSGNMPRINRRGFRLYGSADAEDLGPAGGTDPRRGGLAVFHRDGLRILDFHLGPAFDTICFHETTPYP